MRNRNIKLSVLDQSPVRKGGTARQALLETVELAKVADKLGYTRFWVSEHHNTIGLAGSTPEVLIAHLAGETERIRVGSGGVMIPNHSSLKIAENFRMLESLFPGRIDLGMGRAPGTDRTTARLLNPSNVFSEQDFVSQLRDLQSFFTDTYYPGYDVAQITAIPVSQTSPEFWLLSSSGQSGVFAAHFGMGFSFAHFINPFGGPEVIRMYKDRFQPSEFLEAPVANVGVFVMCADTEEKAEQLQKSMDVQIMLLERGVRQAFMSYDEVKDYKFTPEEFERVKYNRNRMISGTQAVVKEKLEKMADDYGVDEIVVVTITYDFQDRLRSYELLADSFNLTGLQP